MCIQYHSFFSLTIFFGCVSAKVFPHVLSVCQPGLCCSDVAPYPQLATSLQVLSLVRAATTLNCATKKILQILYKPNLVILCMCVL